MCFIQSLSVCYFGKRCNILVLKVYHVLGWTIATGQIYAIPSCPTRICWIYIYSCLGGILGVDSLEKHSLRSYFKYICEFWNTPHCDLDRWRWSGFRSEMLIYVLFFVQFVVVVVGWFVAYDESFCGIWRGGNWIDLGNEWKTIFHCEFESKMQMAADFE